MCEKILEGVLAEFKNLAAIPRPSKHEEKISDFLKNYLTDLGFEVAQDDTKNIIANIPASCGLENAPTTILQAHMDMVCVAEEGFNYNPLTDAIKLVRSENFLEAEGTSLGADDGIGVAEILYIAKQTDKFPHGAIKIIFTTDEEQGMSGAINIDAKHFQGADFMINCDSEDWDEIVVGSAGSTRIDFSRKINFVAPAENFKNAFAVKISGLRGGHSGTEIGKNRANALKLLRNFLHCFEGEGNFQLANFSGGKASNVIPDTAESLIVTGLEENILKTCAENFKRTVEKVFGSAEPNFKIEISATKIPVKVFCEKDFADFMNLLELIHSGVYTMNRNIPHQVESSANLAVVDLQEDILQIDVFARANVFELLNKFIKLHSTLAKVTDFEIKYSAPSPAWNFNPDSKIVKIMAEVFERQNNFAPKVHTIHAGLECSYFLTKNPALDVVSIGTTNENIHSPQERLHLKTVAPQVNLIVETLQKISALNKND